MTVIVWHHQECHKLLTNGRIPPKKAPYFMHIWCQVWITLSLILYLGCIWSFIISHLCKLWYIEGHYTDVLVRSLLMQDSQAYRSLIIIHKRFNSSQPPFLFQFTLASGVTYMMGIPALKHCEAHPKEHIAPLLCPDIQWLWVSIK